MRNELRARVQGRVVIHGRGGSSGEIVEVSTTAIRVRITGTAPALARGDRVELDVRFDGAAGAWAGITGRVVEVDELSQIRVVFDALPEDFEDRIQSQLLATLESEHVVHVLLVDPISQRRALVAASLRATGRRVSEAATPLDAIDCLGESGSSPRMIAVADTVPPGIADELRAYLRDAHADLGLVRMMAASR